VSIDNNQVGVLQATAFVGKLKSAGVAAGSGILMIEGPPTDHTATVVAKAAHSVIDTSGYRVLAEYRVPAALPGGAQAWAASQFASLGNQINGVYADTDANAAGVIAAAVAARFDTSRLALTGQGASLAGLQSILAGSQYMTVYDAIKPEAEKAASLAVALANGKRPTAPVTVFGASGPGVPSFLLAPVSVTKSNIESTVVADGFVTAAQICVGRYAALCQSAGIR
jgi:D-xylose transport system substrate-binding protein